MSRRAPTPVIAVSSCSQLRDYEESLRRAGADVRIVSPGSRAARAVVAHADGVLLTGGGDVDPALYGEPRHPFWSAAEPGRDAFEIALAQAALDLDRPLLAICRGLQVLNVARGGSLYQHIPEQVGSSVDHHVDRPPSAIAHDVVISRGSRLERLLRDRLAGSRCPVNSRHHQAIKRLADGMVATASAPDGVIEAIEDPSARYCLGVQWHPENFWRTGEFSTLFEAFVESCRR